MTNSPAPGAEFVRPRRRQAGRRHVVVGAGPAGLTAAWQLAKLGEEVLVVEADPQYVGGLSRSMVYKGHRYDVGPHHFYTKSDAIIRMWHEMLPDGFVEVSRLTRIYYKGKFFPYPLSIKETLKGIGYLRAAKACASWARARAFPRRPETSFEDWIVNRFGYELYATFFKTYTEKVWGIPCLEISKEWAAQCIRGLSLMEIVRKALFPNRVRGGVKSLIDRFMYPRLGAGQLWESVADELRRQGHRVELGKPVVRLMHGGGRMTAIQTADGSVYEGSHFYLTMTLKELVNTLDPVPPPEIRAAGDALLHRDFMTVALIVERRNLFSDHWIYIHDPEVQVARITNYANWSKAMTSNPATTAVGMDYFCSRGDDLWCLADEEILALAAAELKTLGLAEITGAADGRVHRNINTYPIYDDEYQGNRQALKKWIRETFENVYPAGRKGLHNYNSLDHAMMTATLSVRNAIEGTQFDVWAVNTEEEYAQEGE